MYKKLLGIFFLFSLSSPAQELGSWGDLYSYNSVTDIVKLPNGVYLCAAGRAMYTFDYPNKEIAKFSKANGLSDVNVSAIERDPVSGIVVVGYENANIDVIDGDRIINVSDILNSDKFTGRKRINEIVIRDGIAYLATGFGVVELDIVRRLILDTWVLGDNASELEVFDLAFQETTDTVWTMTEAGILKASRQDPLFFYESWVEDPLTGPFEPFIDVIDDRIFTVVDRGLNDTIYTRTTGSSWTQTSSNSLGEVKHLQAVGQKLYTTFSFTAEERDANGELVELVSAGYGGNGDFKPQFTTRDEQGRWFVGDGIAGLIYVDNPNFVQRARPVSPFSNNVYSVYNSDNNGLFIAPGNINGVWAPTFNFEGFFRLEDESWRRYFASGTGQSHDIIQVLEDPMDPTRFFAIAMGSGLLEYRDGELYQVWNESTTNRVLVGTTDSNDTRVAGMAFDEEGTLWVTTSLSPNSLASYDRDGNWQARSIGNFNGRNVKTIAILENGDFWIQGRNDGIYAVRFEGGSTLTRALGTGEGNGDLSSSFVHDFQEDLDGEIWIGTGEGVMVHFAPDNLFIPNRNYDAQSIIILENGVFQRLLGSEGVLAVEVDGANRKWFGTETGGLFLTSEDGIDELLHFTTDNSPLPSNRIVDVEVNDETGVVYIATDLGVVTYNGDATGGNETMDEVTVFPNPVRPGYTGPIAIRGLVQDAQVKITDVSGNLVFETVANGGQAIWMGDDLSGRRAATGVYLAYITDDLGENTKVVKILLVNGN